MPIQEMSQLLARIRQKVTSLVKRRTSVQALLSELYGRDIEVDRVAGLYESSAARISKIEQDNAALIEKMDALSRSFAAQAEIVNTRTRRADAGALSPLLSPAEIGQLQQQYAAMVSQRDALLNERDGLLVGLQQARRANGLEPLRARANKQRLAFPIQLLPEGRAPNIFVVDIGAQNLTHEEHAYQSLATAGPVCRRRPMKAWLRSVVSGRCPTCGKS